MKQHHKLILGALVVFLGVAIALWSQYKPMAPLSMSKGTPTSEHLRVPSTRARVLPVAQQPKPTTAANVLVRAQKKFAELGVLEEEAIMAEIEKEDLPVIFQAMLDAKRVEQDPLKQMHLQTVLADAFLRKKPTPEFLEYLYEFLNNSANSERGLLIGALGHASTKETVDLLIRVANTAQDPKILEWASGLAGVGASGRGGPELSPALERTWRESTNPKLTRGAAMSMAQLGQPSGVELLLSAALATDGQNQERQIMARAAMPLVVEPVAVPSLAARLVNQPPTSEVVQMIAPVLAKITGPAAQEALVGWLRTRPENAAPPVHDLIRQQMVGDPFASAWATALDPAVPFRNEVNRHAIRAALVAYRAGRTSE